MTSTHPATIRPSSTAPSPSRAANPTAASTTSKPSAPPSSTEPTTNSPPKTEKTSSHTSSKKPGSSAPDTNQAPAHSQHTQPPDYPNESPTGTDNAKTPATQATPATHSTPSTITWQTLTPQAHWTIQHIAIPLNYGYSETEIAHKTGHTRTWIQHQLAQLRAELLNPPN